MRLGDEGLVVVVVASSASSGEEAGRFPLGSDTVMVDDDAIAVLQKVPRIGGSSSQKSLVVLVKDIWQLSNTEDVVTFLDEGFTGFRR